jgi:hypothetical protein
MADDRPDFRQFLRPCPICRLPSMSGHVRACVERDAKTRKKKSTPYPQGPNHNLVMSSVPVSGAAPPGTPNEPMIEHYPAEEWVGYPITICGYCMVRWPCPDFLKEEKQ